MDYAFLIAGENEKLAFSEIRALAGVFPADKIISKAGRTVVLKTSGQIRKSAFKNMSSRLAYTRISGAVLFSCSAAALLKKIEDFPWKSIYKKDFCVRMKAIPAERTVFSEREIGGRIFDILLKSGVNPKVNLENPSLHLVFLFSGKKVMCINALHLAGDDFESRNPKNRPGFSPVGMDSKLCRCMVNLSRAKKGETVLDPFCGTGGILMEAGLCGCIPHGSDIDPQMVEKCRKNTKFFRIKQAQVSVSDATKLKGHFPYIVSDLPYGVSSFLSEKKSSLYPKFFKSMGRWGVKRAVLCIKKGKDEKYLSDLPKQMMISECFEYYIHKSMTKKIVVIENVKE
jgi:tRNA (guanine10-N2)-dimethyltransferase